MNGSNLSRGFAFLVGAFLLIEGVWGLFNPVVFGVLTTNVTHAVIHIALGLVGMWSAWKGKSRGFCIFLGCLLLLVGILWFIPGASDLVVTTLNLNKAVACVNLVIGSLSLIAAALTRRQVALKEF